MQSTGYPSAFLKNLKINGYFPKVIQDAVQNIPWTALKNPGQSWKTTSK
jgi:hypothetical protein